jgi:chemotaxis protein methyltransferase CheR
MRRLALNLAGIELVARHRELLARRSPKLGILDSAGLDTLLDAVEAGDATARQKLVCLLTTKFTGFFRQPRQFEIAARHVLQVAEHRGRARLWSAGAATGEEPYSLAMALIEASHDDEPPASILATDVDMDALAVAQRGEYGAAALRALEPQRRERFLQEVGGAGRWTIVPAVRRLVQFRPLNLISEIWTVEGEFDVILCRNVLMYLEACYRYAVLERIATLLAPDGLLIIDPTEHLAKAGCLFTREAEAVYRSRGPTCRSAIEI